VSLALVLALAVAAPAEPFSTPPPGSDLRKAVLDGLRPAVEKRLGPGIEFKVALVRVQKGWAFVIADPQRRDGRPIDGYRIFGEHFSNMDGLRVDAMLRLRRGRWVVADYLIGATDVWYCDVGPRALKSGWGC
jgi:hypothetical protein